MIAIDTMLVFDLDGVVTDPTSPTNEIDDDIIEIVAEDLREHIPVAFNTGRTVSWVEAQILPHLKVVDNQALKLLTIVGEKGGVVAEYDGQQWCSRVDPTLSLPKHFAEDARALLEVDRGGSKLGDYMFWDEGKLTMGSIEKKAGIELKDFHPQQAILTGELEQLIKKYDMHDFKIDVGVIATDVEHQTAGKHKGAEQILEWLKRSNVSPKEFIAFGDSPSDALMAETFSATNTPTTFVYVGNREKYQTNSSAQYTSKILNGKYAQDTLDYLRDMRQ